MILMVFRMMAPNFGNTTYPMSGAMIGPAWQAAWDVLSDGQWHEAYVLGRAMERAAGIKYSTAKGLLRQARKHGLLEVSYIAAPGARAASSTYRLVAR